MSKTQTSLERRNDISSFEIRAGDAGEPKRLRGYAARFGSAYDYLWFTEEVDKDAFKNADMSDVRALFNHDANLILGRTSAGTAKVGVDEIGLWYEVILPDTSTGEDVRKLVERGDISQSSWGFSLRTDEAGRTIGNKWTMRNGKEHRLITDVETLFDVSPVVFPANPDTTVAKRSLEFLQGEGSGQTVQYEDTANYLNRAFDKRAALNTNK